jgi:hypothetical protein
VTAVPRGPIEYPLGDLSWEQFQSLVLLLARAEDSAVVPVRAKDHGLDARLPNRAGLTLRGWQAKRYTTTINWSACQESVRRAVAFWRPPRITFAFPRDLSAGQQKTFRTELIERFPYVHFDWWGESELQRLVRDTDEGRRAASWLFAHLESDREEMLRAMAAGGPLSDAGDAAKRVAEVQKFMERDPHFNYTVVSSSPGGPAAPPPEDALLSLEVEVDGKAITFHASERYPGAVTDAGVGGAFLFSDDEAGKNARNAVDQVMREGGKIEIASGIAAKMQKVPVGLRGLMPEEPVFGPIEISAGESIRDLVATTPGIPILVRAGSTEVGMVLGVGEPLEGWDRTAVGSAGGLETFLSFRGDEVPTESRMDWRWKLGAGTALEQLLAAEVMFAALHGERVELVTPHDGTVVAAGTVDVPQDEDELAELQNIRRFLTYAAEAEAWLGVPLEPPATPSEEDAKLLGWLIGRIRKPRYTGVLKRVNFTLSGDIPSGDGPWMIALTQPYYGELFGQQLYLGGELIALEKGRFEDVTGKEQAGDEVAIVPAESSGEVQVSFHSPVEAPEEAVVARQAGRSA